MHGSQISRWEGKYSARHLGRAFIRVFIWQVCEGCTLKEDLQIMHICFLFGTYTTLEKYICALSSMADK